MNIANGSNHGQEQGPIIHIPDTHIVPDLPGAQLYATHDIRTIVVASMLYEGRLVGCLNICTFGEVRHFTDDELTMLQGLADQPRLRLPMPGSSRRCSKNSPSADA